MISGGGKGEVRSPSGLAPLSKSNRDAYTLPDPTAQFNGAAKSLFCSILAPLSNK